MSYFVECHELFHFISYTAHYYILSSNKGIFVWPIWPEVNSPYCHTPGKYRLLNYYKIISISRPILARANMGLDFVSGQYGCLFSRCRKYVITSLIHGHFHIGLVIIPRPILALDSDSGQYGGLWMITRPIWKCPCINLYLILLMQPQRAHQNIKGCLPELEISNMLIFQRMFFLRLKLRTQMSSGNVVFVRGWLVYKSND